MAGWSWTRCSEVIRLVDRLDEAKSHSKAQLIKCLTENGKNSEWTDEELDITPAAIGQLIKRLTENGQIAERTDEELDITSEAIGYSAVKHADLKNNRLTDYTFSFEQMLIDKGHTYLQYAHARICSIIRKSIKDVEELKTIGATTLGHPNGRFLGLHLVRFAEVHAWIC